VNLNFGWRRIFLLIMSKSFFDGASLGDGYYLLVLHGDLLLLSLLSHENFLLLVYRKLFRFSVWPNFSQVSGKLLLDGHVLDYFQIKFALVWLNHRLRFDLLSFSFIRDS
jgi:hypothetical protein